MGIGKDFIKQTTLRNNGENGRNKGEPKPELVLQLGGYPIISLPDPKEFTPSSKDVREAIKQRESVRDYSMEPISLEELSYLLWNCQGIRRVIKDIVTLRNVPSAGARHAFETYVLINRVEDLKPGLYHYLPIENEIELIQEKDNLADDLALAFDEQSHIKDSATTFIWVASIKRMTWSYGERGYRYLFLDAGHVCQNVYLTAEEINCGVCAVAHFDDEKVNELLQLNTEEQFTVYAATIGKKQAK